MSIDLDLNDRDMLAAMELRRRDLAHEHIIGISKLTRLVRVFAQRFAIQERIGQQIADTLDTKLLPHGVAVYLEAHHL